MWSLPIELQSHRIFGCQNYARGNSFFFFFNSHIIVAIKATRIICHKLNKCYSSQSAFILFWLNRSRNCNWGPVGTWNSAFCNNLTDPQEGDKTQTGDALLSGKVMDFLVSLSFASKNSTLLRGIFLGPSTASAQLPDLRLCRLLTQQNKLLPVWLTVLPGSASSYDAEKFHLTKEKT